MAERAEIALRLREIASLLELHGGNKFKARAFVRGARAIEAVREPVGSLVAEGRLLELPGIGVALAKQIEELHRTGTSDLLRSLREGLPSGVLELSQVTGIGLHVLRTLSEELGIATVADLRAAAEEGRLAGVKGFGEKKQKKILDAIAKYETKAPKILLSDALRLARDVEHDIEELAVADSVNVAGSVARAQELSEELRLVVSAKHPRDALRAISKLPRVASLESVPLAGGESTDDAAPTFARVRLADGTRVEIVVVTRPELPTTLALARSSAGHVDKLIALAEERGLHLTPRGLFRSESKDRPGKRVALRDEVQLYEKLGLVFIPPELREDNGEIEAAADPGATFDLVTRGDIRGFVHCHSTWSDGRHSLEEMVRAAEARGAAFITVTDHSSAAHYANGLDLERLERQWEAIDRLQEQVQIRILRGTEADILADGAIDWPDRVIERFDVVIASIHARFRQDETKMTERVLRALRHPAFKIWGHPMGRLVTSRPPIPLRVEEVLDAAAESNVAIEINGDPHRLDLEPKWIRAARERGIPFVVSVDAHATRELDNLEYGVALARRGGVRAGEVLNASGADAFARSVRPTGSRRAA